jgi:recombination protein RecA
MSSALASAVPWESFSSKNQPGPRLLPQPVRVAGVGPASELVCPEPETVSCGVRELDALTGGLPRGCLTEICGGVSSGRTSLLLASLAAATRRGEVCVLVDTTDAFDPASGSAAGIVLERLLWVRCRGNARAFAERSPGLKPGRIQSDVRGPEGPLFHGGAIIRDSVQRDSLRSALADAVDQTLRATDLLLQSGGFGLVAVDLGDVPGEVARRIPLASWFRFRRAVENTPAVLLVVEQQPIAGSCSSLLVRMERQSSVVSRQAATSSQLSDISSQNLSAANSKLPAHAQLLRGMQVTAQVVRSRLARKPVASAQASFSARTLWAG